MLLVRSPRSYAYPNPSLVCVSPGPVLPNERHHKSDLSSYPSCTFWILVSAYARYAGEAETWSCRLSVQPVRVQWGIPHSIPTTFSVCLSYSPLQAFACCSIGQLPVNIWFQIVFLFETVEKKIFFFHAGEDFARFAGYLYRLPCLYLFPVYQSVLNTYSTTPNYHRSRSCVFASIGGFTYNLFC